MNEAVEETFWTIDSEVNDNVEASRYEISVDGQVAFLEYERRPHSIVLVHTEVPPLLRGYGIAGILAKFALEAARAAKLRVIALCPFVKAYIEKHHWVP